jgi:hypothetical protein
MPAATSFVRHQWRNVCIYTQHHLEKQPMANAHRVSAAPVEELPADLIRLVTAVQALPDQYSRDVLPALERVIESTKRRRRILTLVQDALSQLRLDMKYLMFDVEATRRERDEYHARLQENESDI